MSEDFRAGPAPAGDAGPQIRLVTVAAGVGALLLAASVVVDVAWADEPVAPQLNLPRPTLPSNRPSDLPSGFPTEFPSEFPTDLPTDLPELPDLPSNFPTELPELPELPSGFPTELPTLPGGNG
jgi:hypothetical protein